MKLAASFLGLASAQKQDRTKVLFSLDFDIDLKAGPNANFFSSYVEK